MLPGFAGLLGFKLSVFELFESSKQDLDFIIMKFHVEPGSPDLEFRLNETFEPGINALVYERFEHCEIFAVCGARYV